MNSARIMVVDDDIEMLKQVAILLENKYTVSLMKSAEQAMESLGKGELPDLILLDVYMPGTDGFSMIQMLKANERLSRIPVIFLTGMVETADEIKGLTLGGSDYIRKPFSREVLMIRISVQLAKTPPKHQISDEIFSKLTENERKVAVLLCEGYSGKETGEKLYFSYSYVKKVIVSLKEKLDIGNTNELIRKLRGSE
ncbi:MAG: response regulator [Ruminococcus sp.]|nr:response regulator [Ruminococcus sp.]